MLAVEVVEHLVELLELVELVAEETALERLLAQMEPQTLAVVAVVEVGHSVVITVVQA